MTLPTTTDVVLLHDGEIEPEERARVLERLGRAERRHLRQLAALSELVRDVAASQVEPPADTVDRIVTFVAAHAPQQAAPSVTLGRRRVLLMRARLRASLCAGLFAAAAAVGLWLGGPSRTAPGVPEVGAALRAPGRTAAPESAAIEAVDFGAGEGTIFVLESETGRTPVVWLFDGTGEAARAHPL